MKNRPVCCAAASLAVGFTSITCRRQQCSYYSIPISISPHCSVQVMHLADHEPSGALSILCYFFPQFKAATLYTLVAEREPWSSLSCWALESSLKGEIGKAFFITQEWQRWDMRLRRAVQHGFLTDMMNAVYAWEKLDFAQIQKGIHEHSLWWHASEQGNEHAALLIGDAYYYGQSGSSVAALLKSLGLEKYMITFQAEEIDMTELIHMGGEDLKALGIPMVFICLIPGRNIFVGNRAKIMCC